MAHRRPQGRHSLRMAGELRQAAGVAAAGLNFVVEMDKVLGLTKCDAGVAFTALRWRPSGAQPPTVPAGALIRGGRYLGAPASLTR